MKKDLILLTADKNAAELIQTLIQRIRNVENLRPISFDLVIHPKRDPGVVTTCCEFLRISLNNYLYAIVLFDFEGSGKEKMVKSTLENEIEQRLSTNGWKDRNKCIVIDPELEEWLWVQSSHLHQLIDWEDQVDVYKWLEQKGFLFHRNKPQRPKEAFELLLKNQRIPRSSSLYAKLAATASYKNCHDTAFLKLKATLCLWFKSS